MLAVGVWTLAEKSDYISLLDSSLYSASAWILIAAGLLVVVTGVVGCCAVLRETRSLLIVVRATRPPPGGGARGGTRWTQGRDGAAGASG